jgi:CheY-like chemotaxis protein
MQVISANPSSNLQQQSFSTSFAQKEIPKNLNILVVEDNRLIQFAVKAMLTELGCNFDIAPDGYNAIGLVTLNTKKRYDLVLMDIDLPDISGIEATKIILSLENAKNIPIVAMTSHTELEYIERCYAVGMMGFYNKPKDTYAIRKIIETHVLS